MIKYVFFIIIQRTAYILIGSHVINIVFALSGGYFVILCLQVAALLADLAMIMPVIIASRKQFS